MNAADYRRSLGLGRRCIEDLIPWAASRIRHCRAQEAKFGAGAVAVEASVERRALQAVLGILRVELVESKEDP